MTIVVGAGPVGDAHAAIDLGMSLVTTLGEAEPELVVASVEPPGWQTGRADAERQVWVDERARDAEAAALALLGPRADGVRVEFVRLSSRSTPRALAGLAQERE